MAFLSEFILDIGNEIELKSGAKINFAQGSTRPTEKWITENEMSQMNAIRLRTAQETMTGSVVTLQQFNPTFFLKNSSYIHCRIPGYRCSAVTQRFSKKIKPDLFLCSNHSEMLTSKVAKRCAEENVAVSFASFKQEDFSGYTSLIGGLEKAFVHLQKRKSISGATNSLLSEAFLNTRNFLFIANALINPDDTITVLAPYLKMLKSFLSYTKNPYLLQKTLNAMREVVNMIFLVFGVNYSWVFLSNPGNQVGGVLGLVHGFVGGVWSAVSPVGILAAAFVGLISGYLIGSGGYDWYRKSRYMQMQQAIIQQYQEHTVELFQKPGTVTEVPELFWVYANAFGDLVIITRSVKQN